LTVPLAPLNAAPGGRTGGTPSFRIPTVAAVLILGLALVSAGCTSSNDSPISAPNPTSTTPAPAVAAIDRRLATVTEPAADLPGYNVRRPADLTATGAPMPIITWANGGCLRYDAAWSAILDTWAASGFVVVSLTTPPGAEGDPRSAGTTSADDQAKAIDWAVAQQANPTSPYAGHLDLTRIAAAGNSCGAVTSVTLAAQDDRVTAVFVLSGSSVLPGSSAEAAAAVMSRIDVPIGYVIGGPEDISTTFARQDYALVPAGTPAYLTHRSSATHQQVSVDPANQAEVAQISTNWLDFAFYGDPTVEMALLEDPCRTCASGTWTTESKDLDRIEPSTATG
jgi:dienelactone hydrolase